MSSRRVRAALVLGSLPVVLLALAGPAHAAPSPGPAPASGATSTPLPEGPWPPDEILARPPADTCGWSSLSGVTTTRPGSAVGPDGVESIVIRGANGQGYRRTATDGMAVTGWGGWEALP